MDTTDLIVQPPWWRAMKTTTLAIFVFCLLSCSERDDPSPADLLIGSWFGGITGNGVHIKISFEAVRYDRSTDEYTCRNVLVDYVKVPYITVPSGLTYTITPEDRFAANDGFAQLDIWGTGDDMWVLIRLKHVKIFKNNGGWTTPGGIPIDKSIEYIMTASEIQIEKTNTQPIILEDQVFIRTN